MEFFVVVQYKGIRFPFRTFFFRRVFKSEFFFNREIQLPLFSPELFFPSQFIHEEKKDPKKKGIQLIIPLKKYFNIYIIRSRDFRTFDDFEAGYDHIILRFSNETFYPIEKVIGSRVMVLRNKQIRPSPGRLNGPFYFPIDIEYRYRNKEPEPIIYPFLIKSLIKLVIMDIMYYSCINYFSFKSYVDFSFRLYLLPLLKPILYVMPSLFVLILIGHFNIVNDTLLIALFIVPILVFLCLSIKRLKLIFPAIERDMKGFLSSQVQSEYFDFSSSVLFTVDDTKLGYSLGEINVVLRNLSEFADRRYRLIRNIITGLSAVFTILFTALKIWGLI